MSFEAVDIPESDERELLREMVKRVGKETVVGIRYVDHLERGPGGKLRFVVSEIEQTGTSVA